MIGDAFAQILAAALVLRRDADVQERVTIDRQAAIGRYAVRDR